MSPADRLTPPAASRPRLAVALMPAELQHDWDLYHATWFTLMGIGGGIFLLARLLAVERQLGVWWGLPVVDLVSFVVIAVGGLVLVKSLGRPFRMLRAVLKPRTSWISRGAIADFIFIVVGGALILPGLTVGGAQPFARLPWDAWATTGAGKVLEAIGLLAAVVVVVYAGLVLADRAAIVFWRSWLVPAAFVLSSLAMSMATVMVMAVANGAAIPAGHCAILAVSLALLLAAVARHVGTETTKPGKTESLARLQGTFGTAFRVGVIGAGMVLPLVLAVLAALVPPMRSAVAMVAVVTTVAGGFGLRLLILRVGYFPPITGAIRPRRR